MKKFILLLAVVMLMPMPVIAQETEKAKSEEEGKTFTVKKGDTLWDISSEFLKDPFKWQTIWEKNPEVRNPHWIYPGDILIILPSGEIRKKVPVEVAAPAPAEKAAEEKEVVPEPVPEKIEEAVVPAPPAEETVAPAPQKKPFTYPGLETTGFIVPGRLKYAGSIIEAKEDKIMLSSGDEVYIDIGENKGAKKEDRYSIYSKAVPIYHPVSGRLFGYKIEVTGILEIEKVHEKASEGRIAAAYDPIYRGDKIVTYEPMPFEIEVKKAEAPIEGLIIANRKGAVEIAEGDIVYLDKGKKKGLEVGNILVVSFGEVKRAGGQKLPPEDVGLVLVIAIREDSSTALVIGSKKPFHAGDKVRTGK